MLTFLTSEKNYSLLAKMLTFDNYEPHRISRQNQQDRGREPISYHDPQEVSQKQAD
jgi:hypothetical protein